MRRMLSLLLCRISTNVLAQGQPNIVFILIDNLGYGEVGVYGGGVLRGAPTPRIDKLASEGTRLTNFNVKAQCTPSRSAILTGRFAIRSGTHSVPLPGTPGGLTQWEVTIPELLSGVGYATAHFGKWHLGSAPGRLPTDQGFDEWYGSGPWRGYYFTHMEGSLRTPFHHPLAGRRAGRPRQERDRDEVDTFTTLATIAGAKVPQDRPIDGVDQSDLLLGKSERSAREGFPVFVADRLEAVKWRNFKLAFYEAQCDWWAPGWRGPTDRAGRGLRFDRRRPAPITWPRPRGHRALAQLRRCSAGKVAIDRVPGPPVDGQNQVDLPPTGGRARVKGCVNCESRDSTCRTLPEEVGFVLATSGPQAMRQHRPEGCCSSGSGHGVKARLSGDLAGVGSR
jgi:hypothetical protein